MPFMNQACGNIGILDPLATFLVSQRHDQVLLAGSPLTAWSFRPSSRHSYRFPLPPGGV